MNSELEKAYSEAKAEARKNLSQASKTTPCVMITEANWNALLAAIAKELELMNSMVTNDQMIDYLVQMNEIFSKEVDWLAEKEQNISKEMESKATSLMERMESQAGKMSEQNASDLAKAKKELKDQIQNNSDQMYHRMLLPCLLTTLLAAVLVLLQML